MRALGVLNFAPGCGLGSVPVEPLHAAGAQV
jgi:hypothetical protein